MKFTKTHEWVKLAEDAEGIASIGISNHAQRELSDVVYVDLPELGSIIHLGDAFMSIESVKTASDVYAPLSGEIVEINESLKDQPQWVNTSPEDEGWLVKIKVKDMDGYHGLMEKDIYLKSIEA